MDRVTNPNRRVIYREPINEVVEEVQADPVVVVEQIAAELIDAQADIAAVPEEAPPVVLPDQPVFDQQLQEDILDIGGDLSDIE